MDEALQALEEFVLAGKRLDAIWEQHLGTPTDQALGKHYPEGWQSFDAEMHDLAEWLRKTREAHV